MQFLNVGDRSRNRSGSSGWSPASKLGVLETSDLVGLAGGREEWRECHHLPGPAPKWPRTTGMCRE